MELGRSVRKHIGTSQNRRGRSSEMKWFGEWLKPPCKKMGHALKNLSGFMFTPGNEI
jgi:hypothetical protein